LCFSLGCFSPVKAVKDMGDVTSSDTFAFILNTDDHLLGADLSTDPNLAALRRILD
jgi:hypothetical protein